MSIGRRDRAPQPQSHRSRFRDAGTPHPGHHSGRSSTPPGGSRVDRSAHPERPGCVGGRRGTVTIGLLTRCGNSPSSNRSPLPIPLRACSASKSKPGARHTDHLGGKPERAQPICCRESIGHYRAIATIIADGHSGVPDGTRRRRPACGGAPGRRRGRDIGEGLVDRPGGQPQVGRSATELSDRPMAASRHHSVSSAKAGSTLCTTVTSSPMEGVMIDWCAPPSAGKGDTGRSADQNRMTARVHPERPWFQRPRDKWVIHHPDRQQWLPTPTPRLHRAHPSARPGLRSRRCRARCAARGALAPVQHRFLVVREPIPPFGINRPDPGLVDPGRRD